ncbi:hypothetical protein ACFCP7_15075 [Paenibacillus elgii]
MDQNDYFKQIYTHLQDGIIVMDQERRIVMMMALTEIAPQEQHSAFGGNPNT